jgi:CheY-like chemotaxis protein
VSTFSSSSPKIVLVDDNADVRDVASGALRAAGYHVIEAANGTAGLDALYRNPDAAVLVTDIIMPGAIDGFSLAERARQLQPSLRVIYMSGYLKRQNTAHGELLQKPLRNQDLIDAVAASMQRSPKPKSSE